MFFCENYRMTLLLGPPSSGKTTLLLALAGKLDSSLKVCFNLQATFVDLISAVGYNNDVIDAMVKYLLAMR